MVKTSAQPYKHIIHVYVYIHVYVGSSLRLEDNLVIIMIIPVYEQYPCSVFGDCVLCTAEDCAFLQSLWEITKLYHSAYVTVSAVRTATWTQMYFTYLRAIFVLYIRGVLFHVSVAMV